MISEAQMKLHTGIITYLQGFSYDLPQGCPPEIIEPAHRLRDAMEKIDNMAQPRICGMSGNMLVGNVCNAVSGLESFMHIARDRAIRTLELCIQKTEGDIRLRRLYVAAIRFYPLFRMVTGREVPFVPESCLIEADHG